MNDKGTTSETNFVSTEFESDKANQIPPYFALFRGFYPRFKNTHTRPSLKAVKAKRRQGKRVRSRRKGGRSR